MQRDLKFIVIGAGMAGILSGIKLREAGFANVAIYEKAAKIGGTWRENTYPGLTCDVPAHSYTYSFAPNPNWSRYLAPGPEIQDYFEQVTRKYGVDQMIRFNEEIVRCEFIDGHWYIETKAGTKDWADVVIAATGVLHHPNYPTIDGIDSFQGALFHSARWDHSVPLDGKRIGIIGTGSTGVQIISALSTRAAQLTHFQRTPQWIMLTDNPAYTEAQRQAFRSDAALLHEAQFNAPLQEIIEGFSRAITNPDSPEMHQIEDAVRANLENSIKDPELREKLRPHYRAACKRLIFSADFYQAVQRPNVAVVTEGIERIEPRGVRTRDGKLHEFDVLVLATGFKADQFMRPMNVIGRNGVELNDVWKKRPSAYMAISIPDFPNLFMLNGPNGPVGNFSLIEIAEQQWHYTAQLFELLRNNKYREISASRAALAAFDRDRIAAAKTTIFGSGCNSWYLDAEGVPATWPWTRARFAQEMQAPQLDAFELVS